MSNNYFKSATGKVVTQWPSGNMVYRALTKVLGKDLGDHPLPRHRSVSTCKADIGPDQQIVH